MVATYIGTVATAANLMFHDKETVLVPDLGPEAKSAPTESAADLPADSTADSKASTLSNIFAFDVLAVALSLMMLLVRSLFIAQVPPYQLGLAAGLCGGLLVWLSRFKSSRALWEKVGFALLLLGWLVSVDRSPPLQAISVSLIAVGLLWQRLHQFWAKGYLLALWAIALQTYLIVWTVVPSTLRDRIIATVTTWLALDNVDPIAWASLGFFPFLLATLGLAKYLRKREKESLASVAEQLALGFGAFLTFLSLSNSFTAAVSLTLSTTTLITVQTNRSAV
ncbi:MAG: hypothetical protein AAFU53_19650, partial [Cyanobacteria bacterium J06632_3]